MQRDFEELPGEQVPALRGKLLALTLHNARASPALRTQLCLALAALAVHLPASEWKVRPRPGRSPLQLIPKCKLLLCWGAPVCGAPPLGRCSRGLHGCALGHMEHWQRRHCTGMM